MRRWGIGSLIGTIVLLAVGCSAGSTPQGGTGGGAAGNSPGGGTSAAGSPPAASAGSASPSQEPAAQSLSAPSASGPLRVRLHDDFPATSSDFLGVIAAEAPDGSVFAAFGSQQSGSAATTPGTAVYVVDGNQPAAVAEHPQIAVTAIAADDSYLYVGGGAQIIEYSRATGAVARTWTLTLPVRLMTAAAGRLWAVLGGTAGPGQVVEMSPQAAAVTTVGTDGANVLDIAGGPLGLYYVPSGGAKIVHVSVSGKRQEAPTHQTVSEQLSGPGAIQAISVIGSTLLLIHDAGQGLDSSAQTYDASTLAGPQANVPGTAGSNHAIDSLGGPVDLVHAGALACSGVSCVGRYDPATGTVADAVLFPASARLGLLVGPYPAVIVFPSGGRVYLDRIG
jgi:hypothetical protein